MDASPTDAELLWGETLQEVAGRAAHELKGALNGVSVNLEVVRGRAAQPEQPATAVARFAASAATQLDHVIEMNEALLALARRPRAPVDVAGTLRHLAALLEPGARASGTTLTVDAAAEALSASTEAAPAAVRTVLARLLLGVIEAGGGTVRLRADDGGVAVDAVASRGPVRADPQLEAASALAGIRRTGDGMALTLTFPGPAAEPAHRGTATHRIA